MDIADTTAPKSDQQNYDDYIAGPKTVTITEVRVIGGEQPVQVHLAEFPGRPFKPSKTQRRVLVECWGPRSADYVGRRMTLIGDSEVKYGGNKVGGIKISHLSHIEGVKKLSLTATRGKKEIQTVQPLAGAVPVDLPPHLAAIQSAETLDALKGVWGDIESAGLDKHPQLIQETNKRKKDLTPDGV